MLAIGGKMWYNESVSVGTKTNHRKGANCLALLTLKNIGKIYVSEGNVAVGIRGVNLSFDRGEFVAVTGKSGSGKSTLLSVISGMDTYEEGDLLIEGRSTAHYLQPDWEEYRQKYISFIFQDYNIIESFTVLQNVELALMHIADRRERRRRALELIDRVGLRAHLRQKGSKLSGGQKQRTVIARALAKDSPIILADEPTGNLDSATGKEIIELLREVSRDKLVIIVTHNFEQVEYCATRHIRIFDGAVESDHIISAPAPVTEPKPAAFLPARQGKNADLRNGGLLGRAMFTSRPKLSVFMCLLMAVGMLGLFFATSMFSDMNRLFEKNYMFRHIDGRVVFTKQTGEVMTDAEVEALAQEYGAGSWLHYDKLIDDGSYWTYDRKAQKDYELLYTYGETVDGTVYGRYPQAADEVFLYLPVFCRDTWGTDPLGEVRTIDPEGVTFRVVGLAYYYDNTKAGRIIFSEEGYRTMLGVSSLFRNADTTASVAIPGKEGSADLKELIISTDVESGKFYLSGELSGMTAESVTVSTRYYTYNYWYEDVSTLDSYTWELDGSRQTFTAPAGSAYYTCLYISADLAAEMAQTYLSHSYRQASLFFENDRAAHAAAEKLNRAGYIAVPSDTTYSPDPTETILSSVLAIFTLFEWILVVLFLAFFINLCSSRTIGTFRGDLAILRSMGIPVRVIRIGMYARMLTTLIPAYLLLAVCAVLIYTVPRANAIFPFLHGWQYVILCVGLLLVTLRVTHKQIRKLFGQSVKKALKGGNAE